MERRLAAIMAMDVVGFSSMMEKDQDGTLAEIKRQRKETIQPLVTKHRGRFVKFMGDGALLEFASAINAVACALEIQNTLATDESSIALRIGINLGDLYSRNRPIAYTQVCYAQLLETTRSSYSVHAKLNADRCSANLNWSSR